jgi:hypothetical protein
MRVNRTILEDLEARVMALRALHAKFGIRESNGSFGSLVSKSYPKSGQP